MSFLSLPQWRGPVRQKSSTPFFPGAWPSTPSGASTTERTSDSDDIEALKRVDGGRSHSSPDSSVPHLGHAPGFSKRGSQSRAESSPARHALGHRTLNVEIPMSPHLTGLSEYTDMSSTSPTESLPTPEQDDLLNFGVAATGTMLPHSIAGSQKDFIVGKKPPRPARNPSRRSSAVSGAPGNTLPSATNSPLVQFTRASQPTQAYSSPTSVAGASYGLSPEQASPGASSCAPHTSPAHSDSSYMPQTLPLSGFASTFFPLADKDSSCGLLLPSTLASTRTLDTDSPVLPADHHSSNATPASIYASRHRIINPLNPSSAELDAFGIAASNIMIEAHSTRESIPTSFQSASATQSMDDTAQGHARRRSSVSLSLSLDSSEHDSVYRASRFRHLCDSQYHLSKNRGRRSPSPALSFLQRSPPTDTRTKVTATHARLPEQPVKPSKFAALDAMKKFGGRIKKLFRGKPELTTNADSEIGVRKHTAVTAVEYTSEHPIPKNESQLRSVLNTPGSIVQSVIDKTPILDNHRKRRETMPAAMSSMPNVSHPRPLRPASFLPTDSTTNTRLLGMPNIIGFSSSRIHLPSSSSTRRAPHVERVHPTKDQPPKYKTPQLIVHPAVEVSAPARSRTQTAPQTARETRAAKDKRFSLTAALGEAIRTTVIPHPTLPPYVSARTSTRKSQDQHVRMNTDTRSASTSAHDAWKAAKPCSPTTPVLPEHPVASSADDDPEPPIFSDGVGNHSEIQIVARNPVEPPHPESARPNRARSQTQSTVQGPGRIRQSSRTTQDDVQGQPLSKRRSRGFSLSSVISKRAMKARSIITGRNGETSPTIPAADAKAGGMATSVSGVSFDIVSPDRDDACPVPTTRQNVSPPNASTSRETNSGCAEYEPDLVLDRMSFATTTFQSTPVSSMDQISLNAQAQVANVPVHAVGITISPNTSSSTFAEDDGGIDSDERQEEREFMRTLGLEFDHDTTTRTRAEN